MYGILGNYSGVVKPWYLPFDWVWCRVDNPSVYDIHNMKLIIVKNSSVPNVYNLPVVIINNKVAGTIK